MKSKSKKSKNTQPTSQSQPQPTSQPQPHPHPQPAQIGINELRQKLEKLVETQTDAGAFRNAGFVVFLLETLADKYIVENPLPEDTSIFEAASGFIDRMRGKKAEMEAPVTEAVTNVVPLPKFVVRRVYRKLIPGENAPGLIDRLRERSGEAVGAMGSALTAGVQQVKYNTDMSSHPQLMDRLVECFDHEMNDRVFPKYLKTCKGKGGLPYTDFFSNISESIRVCQPLLPEIYSTYQGFTSGVQKPLSLDIPSVIHKGIKEVYVLSNLDKYISSVFRFLTSITRLNREKYATEASVHLESVKKAIEEAYAITMTEETMAAESARIAAQNSKLRATLIQGMQAKAQSKQGLQIKKKKPTAKAAQVIATTLGTDVQSRNLDFSDVATFPQDIIDEAFDHDTYNTLVDEYIQNDDTVELLRIVLDASIGIIGFNRELIDTIDFELVSQIFNGVLPSVNNVEFTKYVDVRESREDQAPVFASIKTGVDRIQEAIEIQNAFSLRYVPNSGAITLESAIFTMSYTNRDLIRKTLLLPKSYLKRLIESIPAYFNDQYLFSYLNTLTLFRDPILLEGYTATNGTNIFVQPHISEVILRNGSEVILQSDEKNMSYLTLVPNFSNGCPGMAILEGGPSNKTLKVYKTGFNKRFTLTEGIQLVNVSGDVDSESIRGFCARHMSSPQPMNIHPLILTLLHNEREDGFKASIMHYIKHLIGKTEGPQDYIDQIERVKTAIETYSKDADYYSDPDELVDSLNGLVLAMDRQTIKSPFMLLIIENARAAADTLLYIKDDLTRDDLKEQTAEHLLDVYRTFRLLLGELGSTTEEEKETFSVLVEGGPQPLPTRGPSLR